jgi:hypothetical protein
MRIFPCEQMEKLRENPFYQETLTGFNPWFIINSKPNLGLLACSKNHFGLVLRFIPFRPQMTNRDLTMQHKR